MSEDGKSLTTCWEKIFFPGVKLCIFLSSLDVSHGECGVVVLIFVQEFKNSGQIYIPGFPQDVLLLIVFICLPMFGV